VSANFEASAILLPEKENGGQGRSQSWTGRNKERSCFTSVGINSWFSGL